MLTISHAYNNNYSYIQIRYIVIIITRNNYTCRLTYVYVYMCARVLRFPKGRWNMNMSHILRKYFIFLFLWSIVKNMLENTGLGKWFWKDSIDCTTLLHVGSWSPELGYSMYFTGNLKKMCFCCRKKDSKYIYIIVTSCVTMTAIISKILYVHCLHVNAIEKTDHSHLTSG